MPSISELLYKRSPRNVGPLLAGMPEGIPLCAQVSTAIATNQTVKKICSIAGYDTLSAKQTYALLQKFGIRVRTLAGAAFADFHDVHVARFGGHNFKAIAFINAKPLPDVPLGHAVYIEGTNIFDPETRKWRRMNDADREQFDYLAVFL